MSSEHEPNPTSDSTAKGQWLVEAWHKLQAPTSEIADRIARGEPYDDLIGDGGVSAQAKVEDEHQPE